MKTVGIVGSPRKNGNTEILTAHCLEAIAEEGLETELIRLAGLNIAGCKACGFCFKNPGQCSTKDDMQAVREKMVAADAIIVGTPVYYGAATALVRGLLSGRLIASGAPWPAKSAGL